MPSSLQDLWAEMSPAYQIRATSPKLSAPPWKRVGSDEPGHEYLIELDSPTKPNMADRFPSLDDFNEGETTPRGNGSSDLDGDSDFLTRERAALGDDAAQFGGQKDNAATVEEGGDDDGDLLGGGYQDGGATNGNEEMLDFESSFPAVDTQNNAMAPGGTMTGSTLPFQGNMSVPQPSYNPYGEVEEEPESIKSWRTERDSTLSKRSSVAASKKSDTIAQAQQYIDDFYNNYNTKKDKSIAKTRKEAEEYLDKREDTSAGGTSWERIAKLVDLSGKGAKGGASGTGKERFREMLMGLRKDEKAPGAGGY